MDTPSEAAAEMLDKDYQAIYTVNQGTQTVKKEFFPEKSYKGTDHQDFFDGLRAMGGIVQEGNVLLVKPTLKTHFSPILDELEKRYTQLLKGKAGGSRRRPSRKYKKSKRVLRRKSRSTRRR
jgi:hypothetical protein